MDTSRIVLALSARSIAGCGCAEPGVSCVVAAGLSGRLDVTCVCVRVIMSGGDIAAERLLSLMSDDH